MKNKLYIEKYVVDSFLSNTYLIYSKASADDGEAIVVDPHFSIEFEERLKSIGIRKIWIILTHEHFDHTTGVNWLKEKYNGFLLCQKKCAEKIAQLRNNRPLSVMGLNDDIKKYYYTEHYVCETDWSFDKVGEYSWRDIVIHFRHTPGHTVGSCCIEIEDNVFTGDSLIINEPVTTRFPSGSKDDYREYTFPYLQSLSGEKRLYPGHGICDVCMTNLKLSNDYYEIQNGE